jgi:hypothetical protein
MATVSFSHSVPFKVICKELTQEGSILPGVVLMMQEGSWMISIIEQSADGKWTCPPIDGVRFHDVLARTLASLLLKYEKPPGMFSFDNRLSKENPTRSMIPPGGAYLDSGFVHFSE